eukprot:5782318-Alexandrium_andersonii.AAC.1
MPNAFTDASVTDPATLERSLAGMGTRAPSSENGNAPAFFQGYEGFFWERQTPEGRECWTVLNGPQISTTRAEA